MRLAHRLLGRPVSFPTDELEARSLLAELYAAGYELVIEDDVPPGPRTLSLNQAFGAKRIAAYKREKVDEERIPPVTFHSSNAAGDRV